MRWLNLTNRCLLVVGVSLTCACSKRSQQADLMSTQRNEGNVMEKAVLDWVRQAPLTNPIKQRQLPNFSYDDWFARGRSLPGVIDALIIFLEQEDLAQPSGDGMRFAYALGWLGDRRRRGVDALLRALGSKDLNLRIEAASALGRQGDASVAPVLEKLLADPTEDLNVRGNACVAIGHLGLRTGEPILRQMLQAKESFLIACAQEALRLLGAGP